ncbi:MAG: class I SAM-dependent methyltransferase, partial [Planctomycetota bacterium]
KIVHGMLRTYLRRYGGAYEPQTWWDKTFYDVEISDARTISRTKSHISSMYHYASVELLILRHFANHRVGSLGRVFDVGSGAGHWIHFYQGLGASECVGVDVSQKCVNALRSRFADNDAVTIHHGTCANALAQLSEQDEQQYDVVNAIGVMFHIVDDDEWRRTIQRIGAAVRPGGHYVIGGHFGFLNNLNVQFDHAGRVNKRLRSRTCWRRELRSAGFRKVSFYANNAYRSIRDLLPENNLLIACK